MEIKNILLLVMAFNLTFNADCFWAESETTFDNIQELDNFGKENLGSEKVLKHVLHMQEDNDMTAAKNFESDVNEELVRQAETIANEDLLNGLNTILKNNETLEEVMKIEGVTDIP